MLGVTEERPNASIDPPGSTAPSSAGSCSAWFLSTGTCRPAPVDRGRVSTSGALRWTSVSRETVFRRGVAVGSIGWDSVTAVRRASPGGQRSTASRSSSRATWLSRSAKFHVKRRPGRSGSNATPASCSEADDAELCAERQQTGGRPVEPVADAEFQKRSTERLSTLTEHRVERRSEHWHETG